MECELEGRNMAPHRSGSARLVPPGEAVVLTVSEPYFALHSLSVLWLPPWFQGTVHVHDYSKPPEAVVHTVP
jgi:hypothetical protein